MKNTIKLSLSALLFMVFIPTSLGQVGGQYKPFVPDVYAEDGFETTQAEVRHGEAILRIIQAKKKKNISNSPHYCRAWFDVSNGQNKTFQRYFDDIDPVGFLYGLFFTKNKLPAEYVAVIKNGDYDGKLYLVKRDGTVFDLKGGFYFVTHNKKYLFSEYASDASNLVVFDLERGSVVFSSDKMPDVYQWYTKEGEYFFTEAEWPDSNSGESKEKKGVAHFYDFRTHKIGARIISEAFLAKAKRREFDFDPRKLDDCTAKNVGALKDGATVIGIVEEGQCSKQKEGMRAKPLFLKNGEHWFALDKEMLWRGYSEPRMLWDIGFDGRNLGRLFTEDVPVSTKNASLYVSEKHLKVLSRQAIPTVLNKHNRFAGWCSVPKNRPLVLVSGGGTSDPDAWKPSGVTEREIASLFETFKAKVGVAYICHDGAEKRLVYDYTSQDVEAVIGHKDKVGRQLITLRLKYKEPASECDGVLEGAWRTQTFLLGTQVTYLGAGIELIDAGDYDNDGRSELLFWYSGYNKDGYLLLYDGFARKVEYMWGYH